VTFRLNRLIVRH